MWTGWMYRVVVVLAITLVAAGTALVTAGTAWSAPSHLQGPVLRFADDQAQLTIPSPACPVSDPGCVWKLFMNEPLVPGRPVVGSVRGTAGTLTLDYPEFCGEIQADALVGPSPWKFERGIRRYISNCTTSTSTTTPSTTTSTS